MIARWSITTEAIDDNINGNAKPTDETILHQLTMKLDEFLIVGTLLGVASLVGGHKTVSFIIVTVGVRDVHDTCEATEDRGKVVVHDRHAHTVNIGCGYGDDPNNYNCDEEMIDYNLPVPLATQPTHRLRQCQVKTSYGYCEPQEEPVQERYYVKYSPSKKYYTPYKKDVSRFYQVLQPAVRYYEQQCPAPPTSGPTSVSDTRTVDCGLSDKNITSLLSIPLPKKLEGDIKTILVVDSKSKTTQQYRVDGWTTTPDAR
ncbi:hypothetical protein RUM43_008981 [Polyplax serrata]|uniref:Uncharacterized protein n=1 Tax=Polyplax serrata TaxID=468196 RepID=A0AAN8PVR2_POLSC